MSEMTLCVVRKSLLMYTDWLYASSAADLIIIACFIAVYAPVDFLIFFFNRPRFYLCFYVCMLVLFCTLCTIHKYK